MNSLVIIALNNWLLPDCSLAKCHKCYYSCWNWLNIWRRKVIVENENAVHKPEKPVCAAILVRLISSTR